MTETTTKKRAYNRLIKPENEQVPEKVDGISPETLRDAILEIRARIEQIGLISGNRQAQKPWDVDLGEKKPE